MSDDLSYLDQFVTGAPASAPPTPEQTTTPPEKDLSYLDQFLPPQIARQNQIAAEGKNPEEAAKAFNLAPKVGLPPSIVGMNPQAFEQQATRAQNNALTDANPALAHFVSDPDVAAAVSDDYPALAQIAAAFNPGGALGLEPGDMVGDTGPIAAFLKGGVQSGYAHAAYGSLGLGSMFGFNNEAKLKDYENQFEREKRYEGVDKFAASLGGVVGGLAHNVETGVVGAIGGAAFGPGGAAAGFLAGSVGDFFASNVGTLYRQQEPIRDENGKRIPEPIKIAAALAGGTIATGVGIGLGAAGGRIVGGLVSKGITSVMSRPGVIQALGQFVGGTTEAAVTGGAINAGIAVAQEATPILVREMAGININDPTQWDKVAEHAGEAFVMGSALFGATHGAMTALPIGMNYLADRAQIMQTRAEGEQRLSIVGAMQTSKIMERSQELMRQYAEQQKFPDIHIPADIADKNRDALSYVPDLDQQIARAGAVGGDVKIPAADYFTKTDPKVQGTLNEDVRGPSGLTPREADELEKNPPDYATVYHGSTDEGAQALATTTEQIEASMGLRKPLETAEKKPLWLDPLVEAKAVGMPKNTFAQLSREIQEMQRKITQAAFDHAERELKRRDTPRWKADLAEETEKARTEMEKRPDFKAWYGLVDLPKDDPFSIKVDRNETDALYNRESPGDYAAFQKDGTRASESLPAKMFAKAGEEGLHPDVAAESFGFNSGKDMLDMLRKHEASIRESGLPPAKYFDGLYKAEGRRRMEAKFGNLQENIMKEAIALALDVKQIDVLTTEIEALGGEKITKQRVLDDVRDKATAYTASELKSNFFMRQTGKFGKAAFEAAIGKKYPEALENKLKQLTSFAMAREAKAFEADKARVEKVMDRFGKNGVVDGVDQRFTDRIHQALDKVQMPIPRTVGNLIDALVDDNGKPTTFHEFVNTLQAKTGLEVPVADVLAADGRKAYSEMTVGEVRQLKDTLLSLEEHGRAINSVIVGGQKEALNRVIEDVILPHMDTMEKKRDERPRTPLAQLKKGGRFIDAALLRAEQMFQWLDKNDPFGPMTTLVYRPLKQAEYNFLDHYKAFADDWNKGVSIDRAWKKTLSQKTKNNWLEDEDGDKMTLYRDNMIAMAANVGNEWNMRVLAGGRKWHPDDVMAYLHENMTKKDWEIVQSIWDRFEKLWPDVRDASKARTGIAVERIPSREVITPHGTFRGGYYPLIAEAEAAKGARQTLFGRDQKQTFRTLTSISNATNARTGAVYPVDLSLDRLPYAIRETLHEIHFGETLTNVAKIAQDPLVLKGIRGALGKDYADSIQPWLEYIAHDGGNVDPGALGWLTSGSRYLRQNMVTQLVGFRPSTGFIHGASAAANSWAELGRQNITDQKYLTEALSLLARDPATGDRWATVYKNESGELRHRSHTMERDMRGVIMRDLSQPSGLGKILGDQFDRAMYQTLATKHIAYLDYMSALVVYAAKRAEGLAKGLSLDDAIFAAEQTVRNAHGSAGLMDLPAIARGNEAMKWFTTFYGYFNHNYNRLRDTGRFVKGMNPLSLADYWQVVSRSMGYLVVPAIVHEALRAPPPKPDESYLWWMTKGVGSQIAGGFPFIRDGAHSLVQGKLPEASTPLSEVFKGLARPFKDVHDYEVGREPHDWLGNAVALPGWLTGHLPGATRTGPGRLISGLTSHTGSGVAQWLWDQGLHTPQSWDVDYMRLLLEGNAHPRRGH